MTKPIKLGVSSCLLGEHVRYDGGHKHDRYITDTLGCYFSFMPLTLLKHYVKKFERHYLPQQVYLSPHPAELLPGEPLPECHGVPLLLMAAHGISSDRL